MFLGPYPDVPCNNNPPKIYKKGASARSFLPARVEVATWQGGGSHVCRPGGGSGHIQRIRHIRHPLESLSHSTPCLGSVGHGRGASGFTDSLWHRWGGPGQAVTEQKPGHWSRPSPRFRLTWHHTSYICTDAVEVVAGALTKISLPPEQASTVPDQALEWNGEGELYSSGGQHLASEAGSGHMAACGSRPFYAEEAAVPKAQGCSWNC